MNFLQTGFGVVVTFFLHGCSELPEIIAPEPTADLLIQSQNLIPANEIQGSIKDTKFATLIRKGVADAPSTSAASAVITAAGSRVTSARSAFQPQLGVEASVDSEGDPTPVLRLSQIIYDGGRTKKQVALRRTEVEQVYQSEVANLSARAFEAVETVINLDRDERLKSQAQRNVVRVNELVIDLEDRFDAGAGTVADVLTGKGRLSNAQAELDQSTLDVTYADAAWIEVFGTPPTTIPKIPNSPVLKTQNIAQILDRSPLLREAAFTIDARQQELDLATSSVRPIVSAILETDFDDGSRARLGVSVPIYSGGRQKSEITTAKSRLVEAEGRSTALKRQLSRALTEAIAETSSNDARVSRARKAVSLNEQAVEAAQGQFRLGKGSLLQTLEALRELNDAQVRLIHQNAETKRAEYAILAVTGDILNALGILSPARPAQVN